MAQPVKDKKRQSLSSLKASSLPSPERPAGKFERVALSGWPVLIGWVAMMIFAFHACTHMVAAGDTWVALACGRHFLNHGVDTVEPFSANSHKAGPTEEEVKTWPNWAKWLTNKVGLETVKKWHPTGWINQNWLTHVIFYWLSTTLGSEENPHFNALVYWKFAIYIITVICVYYLGRILGAHPALSAISACCALFIGRSFLDVRPAGFSNMLVAVFLLILVLTAYRNIWYIWLIVPVTVFWANVHGGYIYVFIMLFPFVGIHIPIGVPKTRTMLLSMSIFIAIVVCLARIIGLSWLRIFLMIFSYAVLSAFLRHFKEKFVSIGPKGICYTVASWLVAFITMVLFNPFHFTNLTHTFVISVSKHAERWRDVHEWHPAFDWTNPVGTAVPFLVMYISAWVIFAAWIITLIIASRSVSRQIKRRLAGSDEYQWPKVDLPVMTIAALTIYMAIRSRRFIPIAAIAACPIIAMFIDQLIRTISATFNFHKHHRLFVSPMPRNIQFVFTVIGILVVVHFGTWWGLKFKRIYLDPWPGDPKLTSVFMRMTASDAKPFYAGNFIKLNRLKGKMFNYWTEGGFIAWAQQPDPNTGKTSLQLFMDGRAQAAYDVKTFDLWTYIMSGGPIVQSARARRHQLTPEDLRNIGLWIGNQLSKRNVWIVLMPATQFDKPFVRGLEHNPKWRLVFLNNKQKMFADITTAQGRQLYDGLFTGKTLFPQDFFDSKISPFPFCKNVTLAHNLLLYGNDMATRQRGLDLAIKAFKLNPSPAPVVEIILIAATFNELRPGVDEFCKNYVQQFEKNKDAWAEQNGYRHRVEAARLACIHLRKFAPPHEKKEYARIYSECISERNKIYVNKRW